MSRGLGAVALAIALAGCAPGARHPTLAAAVKPADIAYALCRQYRPGAAAHCEGLQPPSRASETAYNLCLDYHPADPRPCGRLRATYEADLRAWLTAPVHDATAATGAGALEIGEQRYDRLHRMAEKLYIATSRDAETFEAAILIPDVRHGIEQVLGPDLTDRKLRVLEAKSRAESLYWYRYMQGLEHGEPEF